MTRQLSITYGSLVVGGGSSPGNTREIDRVVINERRFESFTLDFDFAIAATSDSAFQTEIDAVEDAFGTPFQNLTITQGSTDLYTFSQSANTGFDARPEITKREDGASRFSRKYGVRITLGLPANTGAELVSGLREHTVEVSTDPSGIRTVTITGVCTAVTTNNARAQYNAVISGLATSVLSALSISNSEKLEEPAADHTYNTKTLSFRRVYRELIFSQGGASLDDSALTAQVLVISRKKVGPGDAPNARRLVELTVDYTAHVDATVSTNLRGKYSSIREWIVNQVQSTLEEGTLALIEEDPRFNYDKNILSVSMLLHGSTTDVLLEDRVTVRERFQSGKFLVAVWDDDPLMKLVFQGPATKVRVISRRTVQMGTVFTVAGPLGGDGAAILASAGWPTFPSADNSVVHTASEPTYTFLRKGQSSWTFDVTETDEVHTFEFYTPAPSQASSPSTGA